MADRPGGIGGHDFWITYQRNSTWTAPKNLGAPINSEAHEYAPKITPDGKYFLWSSTRATFAQPRFKSLTTQEYLQKLHSTGNGLGDIYLIDIDALKIEK
jgi:hypothetical protein